MMNDQSNPFEALFGHEEQLAEMCVQAAEGDDFDKLMTLARSSRDPVLLAAILSGLAAEAREQLATARASTDPNSRSRR